MVESVYTQDLKSCGRKPLRVRVPLPAFLVQKSRSGEIGIHAWFRTMWE